MSSTPVFIWGSTVRELGSKTATEVDFNAGHKLELAEHLSLDLSATYYVYPSDSTANYVEATAVARVAYNEISAGLGVSFAPWQAGTRDEQGQSHRNSYIFVEAACEISRRSLKLTSSLGYERGYFDEVEQGGKWDWSIRAATNLSAAKISLAYIGTNKPGHDGTLVASLFFDLGP